MANSNAVRICRFWNALSMGVLRYSSPNPSIARTRTTSRESSLIVVPPYEYLTVPFTNDTVCQTNTGFLTHRFPNALQFQLNTPNSWQRNSDPGLSPKAQNL